MTAAVLVAFALAVLVWVLKGQVIFSVRGDESEFDPGYDKHVRDLVDDL